MELKKELHNTRLALVWRKQQEHNLSEILRLVKVRCNVTERQNILAKFLERSSLTVFRELKFVWGKKLYVEWCLRKEKKGV
jgi:hypothetical protein